MTVKTMTQRWTDDEARALYLQELACAPRLGARPVLDLEALEARQAHAERQQFLRGRTMQRHNRDHVYQGPDKVRTNPDKVALFQCNRENP